MDGPEIMSKQVIRASRVEKVLTQPYASLVGIPDFVTDPKLRSLLETKPLTDPQVFHRCVVMSDSVTFSKLRDRLIHAGWLKKAEETKKK